MARKLNLLALPVLCFLALLLVNNNSAMANHWCNGSRYRKEVDADGYN